MKQQAVHLDDASIKSLIDASETDFLKDLQKIMKINSVKSQALPQKPFGEGPKAALEAVLSLADTYGFTTKIVDDAVGYAQFGEGEDYIGIVGHLDVVPEGDGWSYPPFDLTEGTDGRLYGRGILDNKGPIFSCLYGLKLLKEQGVMLEHPIRILFGTDEESGSADLPRYLAKEKPPVFGFTPDCKYPAVYGERGIVNYELHTSFDRNELAGLTEFIGDQARDHVPDKLAVSFDGQTYEVTGKRAPTNAPELGENAITLLSGRLKAAAGMPADLRNYFSWLYDSFHEKHFGEGLGIDFSDEDSGKLIITPYELQKAGEELVLSFAIRYPVTYKEDQITTGLEEVIPAGSYLKVVRRMESVLFPKDSVGVKALSQVYEDLTGLDGTPVTTTGATYARSMPNIIAFGPSFPGQKGIAHNKDEYMDKSDLLLNMAIYMQAIQTLGNTDL